MLSARLTFLVFGLVLIASSATANQLTTGSGPLAPDKFSIGYSGNNIHFKPFSTFTTGTVTGTYFEEEIADPANPYCPVCLDFIFQVRVDNSSAASLTRVTLAGYSPYQTDVGYDVQSVGALIECGPADNGFCEAISIPDTVDRMTADVVGFNFSTGGGIAHGTASVSLVIETDATLFTDPGVSFFASDGSSALNLGGVFGPSGPPAKTVPEPSAAVLLGVGVLRLLRKKCLRAPRT